LNCIDFQQVQSHAGMLCGMRTDTVSGEFTSLFQSYSWICYKCGTSWATGTRPSVSTKYI